MKTNLSYEEFVEAVKTNKFLGLQEKPVSTNRMTDSDCSFVLGIKNGKYKLIRCYNYDLNSCYHIEIPLTLFNFQRLFKFDKVDLTKFIEKNYSIKLNDSIKNDIEKSISEISKQMKFIKEKRCIKYKIDTTLTITLYFSKENNDYLGMYFDFLLIFEDRKHIGYGRNYTVSGKIDIENREIRKSQVDNIYIEYGDLSEDAFIKAIWKRKYKGSLDTPIEYILEYMDEDDKNRTLNKMIEI